MASTDKLYCHLTKCIQPPLDSSKARVEVKSFEVPADERLGNIINWKDNGDAMFHDICWKALIDSYKNDNPFPLEAREREMLREAWRTAEYFDNMERVRNEALRWSHMLKTTKYPIAFTGAGISTIAGIGDFRGRCGKWTEKEREKRYGSSKHKNIVGRNYRYEDLRPSYTHESLRLLVELGYIKHIISQNTDSLHTLSGVSKNNMTELHGSSFHEKCEKCCTKYERPYAVRRKRNSSVPVRICNHCHLNHRTGRKCEKNGCDGYLMNCIINFGDGLDHNTLAEAEEHAQKSDLVLCLGSSLKVAPACEILVMGQKPIRLAICNRQPTSFDGLCYQIDHNDVGSLLGSRVFCNCDTLMREIIKLLLSEDELKEFEDSLDGRMEIYAKQRDLQGEEFDD